MSMAIHVEYLKALMSELKAGSEEWITVAGARNRLEHRIEVGEEQWRIEWLEAHVEHLNETGDHDPSQAIEALRLAKLEADRVVGR